MKTEKYLKLSRSCFLSLERISGFDLQNNKRINTKIHETCKLFPYKTKFRLLLTVIPLLSKLFVKQSVRNSPPIGEDATACEKKRKKCQRLR